MSTQTDQQKIYEDLVGIGFSDHEARIYLALALATEPATAYELAKAAQIPVANTYNVMRSLAKKGVSSQVAKDPVRYIAKPPSEVFAGMASAMQQRCDSLVSRFDKIRPQLADDYVEILNGVPNVEGRVGAMIDGSAQQLVLKSPGPLSPALTASLEAAVKRGVRVMMIYYGAEPKLPKGQVHLWPHEGNAAEMGSDFFTITVDSKAGLAFNTVSYLAAYSENPTFVYLVDVLLRHEIYLAEIMTKLSDEVEENFGPALHKLRSRFGMVPINEQMQAYIDSRKPQKRRVRA
jgi:sugar-specific transcriptional regulator TrmB